MLKTEFYDDFLAYYDKAEILQNKNLNNLTKSAKIDDKLMNSIPIYDVVNRRYAGFSKVLEDTHGERKTGLIKHPCYENSIRQSDFLFLHLFHRFTGSGASFQPTFLPDGSRNPKEHGYYNNHVDILAQIITQSNVQTAIQYIAKCEKPMVTSTGNQPPSLKNKMPEKYRLAMQYYFDNYAMEFISHYHAFLLGKYDEGFDVGIKEAVDFCCGWHKSRGFKQWHFVLTASVMDTAEYYPHLVDPSSHCYYGSNCIKAFKLMFTKEKTDKMKNPEFYEACMTELVKARPQSLPYDMEDVCCDAIRYWTEYVPKGYDHLSASQIVNNSTLKDQSGQYRESAIMALKKIVG